MNDSDEVELCLILDDDNNDYTKNLENASLKDYLEITKDKNGNDVLIQYFDEYHNLTTKDKAVHKTVEIVDANDEALKNLLR